MATLLRVPEVATGSTEAVLTEWLIPENEPFPAGAPIAVLETDKAAVEIEAETDAAILHTLIPSGSTVAVGTPIAVLGTPGENITALLAELSPTPPARTRIFASPLARKLLKEAGIAPTEVTGTGPNGRIIRKDAEAAITQSSSTPTPQPAAPQPTPALSTPGLQPTPALPTAPPQPTPALSTTAPQPAATPSTNPPRPTASLPTRAPQPTPTLSTSAPHPTPAPSTAAPQPTPALSTAQPQPTSDLSTTPPQPTPAPSTAAPQPALTLSTAAPQPNPTLSNGAPRPTPGPARAPARPTDIPHSRIRHAIATRLTASKQTIPHFYLRRTARIGALLALRKQLNDASPTKISVNDLIIKAVAIAHRTVPDANVIWTDDALRRYDTVDIGVAIASTRGLVTPVLRGVESSSLSTISSQIKAFARAADDGKLMQHDLEGGTITISNLGMCGVDEFAAIINPPQSAILAVGAGKPAPAVVDGELTIATQLTMVLSVDHRAIDGALAAQWMAALVDAVETPMRLVT